MPCRCDYPEPSWNEEYKKIYDVYIDLKDVFPSVEDWGWRTYNSSVEVSKSELDEKTETLCKFINSRTKIKFEQCSPRVKDWITEHNRRDYLRKQEEESRAKWVKIEKEQKEANIARMTPAERKLFDL